MRVAKFLFAHGYLIIKPMLVKFIIPLFILCYLITIPCNAKNVSTRNAKTANAHTTSSDVNTYVKKVAIENFCSDNFKHLLINLAKRTTSSYQLRQHELTGWLDLIKINESISCQQHELSQQAIIFHQLEYWHSIYYNHPGSYFFPNLFKQTTPEINKIAIMLPFEEKYNDYSINIFNVIKRTLKDSSRSSSSSISVKSFDTSTTDVLELYHQANNEQFSCIIGPLRTKVINQLSQYSINIPVLALTPGDTDLLSSSKFFRLSKMTESEANQLVQLFDQKNYQRGILLYPKNNLKQQKMAKIISQQFIKNYGQWLSINTYQKNYADIVQSILHTKQSISRYKQIKRTIASDLEFTPRRRKDIDFIVLLGTFNQIQQLYPQLRYWYADNIPVYTSSAISRYLNKKTNKDLLGIKFISPFQDDKSSIMAKQAANIIIQSQCLRLGYLFKTNSENLLWKFIPDKGIFEYKK